MHMLKAINMLRVRVIVKNEIIVTKWNNCNKIKKLERVQRLVGHACTIKNADDHFHQAGFNMKTDFDSW